jgi:hypothetical protein
VKGIWHFFTLLPRQLKRSPSYAFHFLGLMTGWITAFVCAFLALVDAQQSNWESFQTRIAGVVIGFLVWRFFDISSVATLVRFWTHPSYKPTTQPKRPKIFMFFEPLEIRALQQITGIADRAETHALLEKNYALIGGHPAFLLHRKISLLFSGIFVLSVTLIVVRIMVSPFFPLTLEEFAPGFFAFVLIVLFFIFLAKLFNGLSERIARVAMIAILETDPSPLENKILRLSELGFDLRVPQAQNREST